MPARDKNTGRDSDRADPCRMATMRLKLNAPCGRGMRRLVFAAPPSLRSGFRVPGQFLEIKAVGEQGFFAIASAPAEPNLELLVKEQTGLAAHLCQLSEGAEIGVAEILGRGFDLSSIDGRPLHLFSMGSGLAPLRALLRALPKGPDKPTEVFLWQASFSRSYLPYPEEFPEWEQAGVRVFYCFDQEGTGSASVPERLRSSRIDLSEAVCVWVGSPAFGESVRTAAIEMGAHESRVLTNF